MPGVGTSVPSASGTRSTGACAVLMKLAVQARRLIAVLAVWTRVVGSGERADHELPRLTDLTALPTSSTMPQYSCPIGVGPLTG
jgi:hypothetical protein